MNPKDPYFEINRESWNQKVQIHLDSDFYDMKNFKAGNTSLNPIELDLLGDLTGKSILHLQCHFGQDSISLARLGALVTAVDLSDKAIETARNLATELGTDVQFICCNLYDLPEHLDADFDYVFTSYGTIGWLPDLDRWATIISKFLKSQGKFVMVEFHPVVWMFDEQFKTIEYPYLNSGALFETESGTYADKSANLTLDYVMWNHGLCEVINPLLRHGLEITAVEEFDYSPYDCFENTYEFAPKKYRIKHLENKIPMIYSLTATKKSKLIL